MKDEIKEILELYKNDDIEYYNLVSDLGYDKLLNYITNLKVVCEATEELAIKYQKENERLKTALEENNNVSIEKYNKLKLEKEGLQLRLSVVKDYKSRNEKALDKLYCYGEVFDSKILQQFQKEMENILTGGDDND